MEEIILTERLDSEKFLFEKTSYFMSKIALLFIKGSDIVFARLEINKIHDMNMTYWWSVYDQLPQIYLANIAGLIRSDGLFWFHLINSQILLSGVMFRYKNYIHWSIAWRCAIDCRNDITLGLWSYGCRAVC